MALSLSKSLMTGVTASYWKITVLHLDFVNNIASIVVSLYLDQANCQAGKQPVAQNSYQAKGDAFGFSPANTASTPLAIAYTYIKTLADFSGSKDV